MFHLGKNKGFMKIAFIIIVAIAVILFFVDFKSLVDSKLDSKRLQNNVQYIKTLSVSIWEGYISTSAFYIWNKIFVKLIYTDLFLHIVLPKLHLKTPPQSQAS